MIIFAFSVNRLLKASFSREVAAELATSDQAADSRDTQPEAAETRESLG
jgi:hypothetical protein